MSLEHWLGFVAASAVLLAILGPTILLVISYALGQGRKAAGSTVAGIALGGFTAMTASMIGLGALLATSYTLASNSGGLLCPRTRSKTPWRTHRKSNPFASSCTPMS
jgi:hypothetical protein